MAARSPLGTAVRLRGERLRDDPLPDRAVRGGMGRLGHPPSVAADGDDGDESTCASPR